MKENERREGEYQHALSGASGTVPRLCSLES